MGCFTPLSGPLSNPSATSRCGGLRPSASADARSLLVTSSPPARGCGCGCRSKWPLRQGENDRLLLVAGRGRNAVSGVLLSAAAVQQQFQALLDGQADGLDTQIARCYHSSHPFGAVLRISPDTTYIRLLLGNVREQETPSYRVSARGH